MRYCSHCKLQHPPGDPACPGRAVVPFSSVAVTTEADPSPSKGDLRGTMVGSWQIVGLLGKGGMGKVYAARDPVSDAQVAVKVLDFDADSMVGFPPSQRRQREEEFKERFLREAQVASRVGRNQPNIIQILTYGRLDDDRPFFVMELLHGRSLAERITKDPPRGAELRRLLEQVCHALVVIHRADVQHRDLKPENIWVCEPTAGPSSAKVLDFGLSKLQGANNLTRPGETMGSVHYMSPEQAQARPVDARTDIYAFGSVLREIITGKRLFDEPGRTDVSVLLAAVTTPPPPLVPREGFVVSPELDQLISDCLQKTPELRPQTIAEVRERLMSALDACANCEGHGDSPLPSLEQPSLREAIYPLTGRTISSVPAPPLTDALIEATTGRARLAWALGIGVVALAAVVLLLVLERRIGSTAAALGQAPTPISASATPPPVVPPTPHASAARTPVAILAPPKTESLPTGRTSTPSAAPRVRTATGASPPIRPAETVLQPAPPPTQTIVGPEPAAYKPAPRTPALPAERTAVVPTEVPPIEARKPSRRLTPSERDLITDEDVLLK
jgi:serine/threonine protein kinase